MDKKPLIIVTITAISIILFFVLFLTIKYSNNSNVIRTNVSKDFTIALDSNPTTGYKWEIASPFNTKLLKLIDSNYIPAETDLIGTPGKEDWVFRAIKQGKTIISFNYLRPWEKDTPPVKKDHFIIMISK